MAEVDNFNLDTQDIPEDNFFAILQDLKFDPSGLLPAIVQDADTGQVLMMAWMNAESLRLTLSRGETWFWSRSRQALWHKGGSSGNIQKVWKIYYDCDGDTLLIQVAPAGPACHTGQTSCFYRELL
jgi:phosphoribosyl-AMP cyclohydrolase